MFGETVRKERESLGLSRPELCARILIFYETGPAVNTIRDLENGSHADPQNKNRIKILFTLSKLRDEWNAKREKRNLLISGNKR